MSTAITEEKLEKALKTQTEEIVGLLHSFMQQVDERFTEMEARLAKIEASIDRLTNTIDGFVARIDHYETELAARDRQFERLVEWARKVSEKTGIPLENL